MENKSPSSIFGFYFVVGLMGHMGWPRRKSIFNSEAVFNSVVLDGAVDQMIDWSATIGACRPDMALQMIATMFRGNNWDSEHSFDFTKVVNDSKKLWGERGNSNARAIVQPIRFSKLKDVISSKDLKSKDIQFLLEQYCFESLIWGLVNPSIFKAHFETHEKSQTDRLPEYQKAGLDVDSIPDFNQILREGEEILKGYEREVRPLSQVPERLAKDVHGLGIEIGN